MKKGVCMNCGGVARNDFSYYCLNCLYGKALERVCGE